MPFCGKSDIVPWAGDFPSRETGFPENDTQGMRRSSWRSGERRHPGLPALSSGKKEKKEKERLQARQG
jgi:hypothetical protein